ncbi:MAG: hypothetical protein GXP49_05965 [Deltaproteobacteria bacterium]|nr:hypothetical protein [Deltaproteobacteria bacterium]
MAVSDIPARRPMIRIPAALVLILVIGCAGNITIQDVKSMKKARDVRALIGVILDEPGNGKRSDQVKFLRARDEAGKALVDLGQVSVPSLVLALKNSKSKKRTRVAWVLSRIRPQGALALVTWAQGHATDLDIELGKVISDTGIKAAVSPLLEAFNSSLQTSPGKAAVFARLIGKVGVDNAGDVLAGLWGKAESPKLKTAILNGLGFSHSKAGIRLASAALADPDPEVRQSAARALGRMGGKGVEAVVRLFYSARPSDRVMGVTGVLAAGKKAAIPLVAWLGPIQNISIDTLERLADAIALAVMDRGGKHQLQSRLGRVALILARGLPETAIGLLGAFNSRNPVIRREAALVLGLMQSLDGLPSLAHVVVEDPDPMVRAEATKAMALVCDESSVVVDMCKARREAGTGEDVYSGPDIEIRMAAQGKAGKKLECDKRKVLANCEGVALPALSAAARDRSVKVRLACAKALVQLTLGGDLRRDPLLADALRLLARDDNEDVRFEARQGARTLDGL